MLNLNVINQLFYSFVPIFYESYCKCINLIVQNKFYIIIFTFILHLRLRNTISEFISIFTNRYSVSTVFYVLML